MKIKLFTMMSLLFGVFAYAQTGSISGTITDAATGEPLLGTNIIVRGTNTGATTNESGYYKLELDPDNYTIEVFFIGYETVTRDIAIQAGEDMKMDFSLEPSASVMDEVVVSANRRPQKITRAPATVNVISAQQIADFPGPNPGELAARQKGVDFVRTGVQGTGINIRGFNSAFNSKNLQVEDGRISSLVATGLPLGSFTTITKEDIERVEIILGPNAALYGPNAHNGLVNTLTKDPRTSEGLDLVLGAGNQKQFTARGRYAMEVNDNLAFKVWGERTQGEEFDYVDSVYVGTTAYDELELDRDFSTTKYGAAVYYGLDETSDLIASYGHSNNSNLGVTNAGRNQIKDWSIDYLQLKYVSPHFYGNLYHTWSKTDDTYAINQRTQNYVSFINNGFTEAEALERSFTEQWFPIEGIPNGGISLPRGSVFKDASKRLNAEAQYNNNFGNLTYVIGAQYQQDNADSKGTYLLDEGGIKIDQVGVYGQLEYTFEDAGLDLLFVGRYDDHELYGGNFIPKAAIVKNFDFGSFRLTYGKGIAAPSILNLSGNLFGGLVLGNGEGFTLQDGTEIPELQVETIKSWEVGYKGKLFGEKTFFEANAYYNMSEDFLSPLINISATSPVARRGDTPIGDLIPGSDGSFVLTYLNFGKVDTYGADLGINYFINDQNRLSFNYSYFGYDIDKNDPANDGNRDGLVLDTDLPLNTPENKFGIGYYYTGPKFFGSLYGRYVQEYDFFSGINIAAETQDLNGDGVDDVIENARNGRTWNYGPLGGFFNLDLNVGYKFNENWTVGASVTNLFDSEVRQFVASPEIGRLFLVELKYHLPIGKN
ncbi:iron complex outermembrane receptor protein [Christiangramia gaetbulicola]|uniref:Iron complex outermembrane receptor protein n=1 Tax=Christiangramia gaetbulicola TaxID=703340 RepID=A0A2T6AL21_9FLAO|nr:TonB-dependent receptor [Christiangramia gaetbulicola]PTX44519.1 iron complex outermembrane receptor protein [Christiangramia gaetbulicola]